MKTRHSKYFLPIAALLTGCFFVMAACENDPDEVKKLFEKKVGVEEGDQIVSYLSQDGYVKAKLTAPYMRRYLPDKSDSQYVEFPRTLHVDFYDSLGNTESLLDAYYGKYYENDRKVLLKDSVLVINLKNGDTLRTQKLWWDQNKSQFYTDDTAYIYQPDKVILAARGLEASQNLNNIKFFSSSGVLAVPKSDSTGTASDSTGAPPDSLPAARPRPAPQAPVNRDTPLKRPVLPFHGRDSLRRGPAILRQRNH